MAGLYIHIPFCHSKCAYCDFYSMPVKHELTERFTDCLEAEYSARRHEIDGTFTTLYLGGGTPSILPQESLKRIFGMVESQPLEEVTIEVNPEDVTPKFIDFLKNETPVNRVSMGVQSLNDSELQLIGRRHTALEALTAARSLREAGFNLSLDLIYGLPGQTMESWRESLNGVLETEPDHLSAYILSYEPGTRLSAMLAAGKISQASDELVLDMYSVLCSAARERGYAHYEISNFARPGREAKHNSSYWDMTPYLGLGPGAHSFDGKTRRSNPHSLRDYVACGGRGFAVEEEETPTERLNDFIITTLRTARGLDLVKAEALFSAEARSALEKTAGSLAASGRALKSGTTIVIPESQWPLADSIMLEFIQV